jgi:DNA-binding NarL/FixJ family response regulator/signal transduction histidine kinase
MGNTALPLDFYLTPAALSYLTQFILVTLFSGYFLLRMARRTQPAPTHLGWFTAFLILGSLCLAAFFVDAACPLHRLYAVAWQVPLLAGSWFCLIQFAYRFPMPAPAMRREARLVGVLSGLYVAWETGYVAYRYQQLAAGVVVYRIDWSDYLLLGFLLLAPFAFLRQLYQHAPASAPLWLRPLVAWRNSPTCRALSQFLLIFLFFAGLGVFNLLRTYYLMPVALANAGIALGILLALFALAQTYLGQQSEPTSFIVKLVGITLTTMLGILGLAGWIIAPTHTADHNHDLAVPYAIRFMPEADASYRVAAIPLAWEGALGQDLRLDDGRMQGCSAPIAFPFPFYAQTYDALYVCNDGVIALGQPVRYREFQYRYGAGVPLLIPLLTDLDPTISAGVVFAQQLEDRLIVTWDQLRHFRRPEAEFSFQAVLYADGRFEFHYQTIPEYLAFHPNDDPGANLWVMGALPGWSEGSGPAIAALNRLELDGPPLVSGPDGMLHDFYLEFRFHIHRLMAGLGWLILIASALISFAFPLLFYVSLVRPLDNLLGGVRRMEAGNYAGAVPVQTADEIGFLTGAFNRLAHEQGNLIATLEARVAERTATLDQANRQLQQELHEREQLQAELLAQQRDLARLEEREEIGRELHDGLAQVLGYASMQAQAAETLINAQETTTAMPILQQLARVTQEAHTEVRQFILGVRPSVPGQSFSEMLHSYAAMLANTYNFQVQINAPRWPAGLLRPECEAQIWRIIQEALTNVRKHAGTSAAQVICTVQPDHVQIIIADDGQGFVVPDAPDAGHFGLTIMRERAAALGGSIAWQTAPGEGTQVVLTVPRHVELVAAPSEAVSHLRVVLVDDHPLFREGLHNLLTAHGVQVVGIGSNGEEALALARLAPDLMLLDVAMPVCDGLQATQRIKAAHPHQRIVLLTVEAKDELLFAALKAGAAGYLLKNIPGAELLERLAQVMQGETVISAGLANQALHEFARQATPTPELPALSPRQLEILSQLAAGLTYKEIAEREAITERTVRYHVGEIITLLQVKNRREAIALARQYGLDKPGREA